jgi:hypothetical protein
MGCRQQATRAGAGAQQQLAQNLHADETQETGHRTNEPKQTRQPTEGKREGPRTTPTEK